MEARRPAAPNNPARSPNDLRDIPTWTRRPPHVDVAARKPTVATSILLALAGVCLFAGACLASNVRPLTVGMGAVGALAFFLASYLHYRKARRAG